MDIMNLAMAAGVPVLRSVSGWAVKALEDKKVTDFEWKELIKTVVNVGAVSIFAFFGLNGIFGLDVDALSIAAGTTLATWVFSELRK